MTESELRKRYEDERPIYDAYGAYVKNALKEEIQEAVDPRDFGELFKIPPTYRTKEPKSFVEKALYRGKDYESPYEEVTDKVGIRFVVLLQIQLRDIAGIVEGMKEFDVETSRDFEAERLKNPVSFEYQSIHYIVRPEFDLEVEDGITVPEGAPCEVQLRTLLQHAHSELTHNTVYKPRLVATPEVRRAVAKSMALIETTGDVFSTVEKKLQDMEEQYRYITDRLTEIYETFGTPEYEKRLNDFLLDELQPLLEEVQFDLDEIAEFYTSDESNAIIEYVQNRPENSLLYRQPVILLVIYLVKEHKFRVPQYWPLPEEDLQPIYSQFGYSLGTITGRAVR
jgi:ppGpp synthetase/RelA/SpoT-type nucleotidyltranferase